MGDWQRYIHTVEKHTVVGDLRLYPAFYSPQLDNARDVLAWLPAAYAQSDKRYPVLYMHDAQNLFDTYTSYVGEWGVDETMQMLEAEGYEAIVVGLPNMNEWRRSEYDPYGGRGDTYLQFLVETVKPFIDGAFRTLPDATHTGIAGSSMGGLISLYGFLRYPAVFGYCGAFSPAFWFGDEGLRRTIAERADGHGKIYLDVGGREGEVLANFYPGKYHDPDGAYVQGVRDLRDALLPKGYQEAHNLLYVEDAAALHNEGAWEKRLPDALRFLLPR